MISDQSKHIDIIIFFLPLTSVYLMISHHLPSLRRNVQVGIQITKLIKKKTHTNKTVNTQTNFKIMWKNFHYNHITTPNLKNTKISSNSVEDIVIIFKNTKNKVQPTPFYFPTDSKNLKKKKLKERWSYKCSIQFQKESYRKEKHTPLPPSQLIHSFLLNNLWCFGLGIFLSHWPLWNRVLHADEEQQCSQQCQILHNINQPHMLTIGSLYSRYSRVNRICIWMLFMITCTSPNPRGGTTLLPYNKATSFWVSRKERNS